MVVSPTVDLRADARGNRDRIIASASQTFAELGTAVSMTDVAKRASVGVATLFRRFPTKESLIDAVFESSVRWWLGRLPQALEHDDSWAAFCTLVAEVAAEQARHPACADMLVSSFLHGDAFAAERATVKAGFDELIQRSIASGQAVSNLAWSDVAVLLEANAGVVMADTAHSAASSQRLVGRLLTSFAAAR